MKEKKKTMMTTMSPLTRMMRYYIDDELTVTIMTIEMTEDMTTMMMVLTRRQLRRENRCRTDGLHLKR